MFKFYIYSKGLRVRLYILSAGAKIMKLVVINTVSRSVSRFLFLKHAVVITFFAIVDKSQNSRNNNSRCNILTVCYVITVLSV